MSAAATDSHYSVADLGPLRPGSKYERKFWEYHRAHPWLAAYLASWALEKQRQGFRHTFRLFWERLREGVVEGRFELDTQDDKLAPFYAEYIERVYPELRGYFRHRRHEEPEQHDPRSLAAGGGE